MRTILKSRFRPSYCDKVYAKAIANESPFLKFPLEGFDISMPSLSPKFSQGIEGEYIAEIEVQEGSHFYGGGETSLGLCLNNKTFYTWCQDAYGYDSKSNNLYQAHPYVMGVNKDGTSFGVIADTHYPLEFRMSDSKITIRNGPQFATTAFAHEDSTFVKEPFSVVIFEEKSPQELIKKLAYLTGKIPMPPKWSLGYHQCRWSYYPDVQALEICEKFRERKIPCDVIWFDIHYMDGYRVFTFDKKLFPNPKRLNSTLKELGFHSVWMIDPGVKKDEGYFVYDQCVEKDLAVKLKKDSEENYIGNVWPGPCVFPDFTMETTRKWWASLYKDFMDNGVDGVWNDMNEPAVLNTANRTMDVEAYHRGFGGGDHHRFHNVYGMLMIKASRDGIMQHSPNKRPFLLSRSSFLGGQKYAATWTGDNISDWEHLKLSIPMVLNLSLSGQAFSGPDIGGFANNADATMFARWMGFGTLLPFARGHTHVDTGPHEPWSFGSECEVISRIAIERRYKLLPYIYTLFYLASTEGSVVAAPTFFLDPRDQHLRTEDNSFLLGENLLVIANTKPEGDLEVNPAIASRTDWHSFPIDEFSDPNLPLLKIREGSIIPTYKEAVQNTMQLRDDMEILLYISMDSNGKAKGVLYDDEGDGYDYQDNNYCFLTFEADENKKTITIHQRGERKCNWKITPKVINREIELTLQF